MKETKSKVVKYDVRLQEAQLKQESINPLFDKERRVKSCLALAYELCDDIDPFGSILRTILDELKAAILSDEPIARDFFGCGIFSDTATVAEIQARTNYDDIPCFLLLDIAYQERTQVLHATALSKAKEAQAKAKQDAFAVNERLLRREINIARGELAETKGTIRQSQQACEGLHAAAIQQQRDMAASTLSLQREMQAMSAAITQYQTEIRELRHVRDATDALRKDFERVRCEPNPAASDPATKELTQSLQTDMQLLLLRNTRLREYERDIRLCSPEMRHKFRKDFTNDMSSLLDELEALERFISDDIQADRSNVPDTLRTLLEPVVAPRSSLWEPFVQWHSNVLPKCIPEMGIESLDLFFVELWTKVSTVERKWEKWCMEHDRDTRSHLDNNDIAASEVVPLHQACIDFVEDRYGEPRAAVVALVAVLQAIDAHVEENSQVELFGSVFAGQLCQAAWWYLMRVKTHVAQLDLDVTNDQALRAVGQYLLAAQTDTYAVDSHMIDAFVVSVHLHVRGELTTTKFFNWLATRIMVADELHFRSAKMILFRNEGAAIKDISMVIFAKNVVDCAHLPRNLISRYFRAICDSIGGVDTREAIAPLDRVIYMLAYIQLAQPCTSTS
ncbi:unnamed protein product [Aphanomyces euteiches]